MKIGNFFCLVLILCTSPVIGNPSFTLEIPNEIDVSISQIICTEEGLFLNFEGRLLPVSAIFETENGYKIVPRAGERMITCRNCGASNPNYYIRCWKCNERL